MRGMTPMISDGENKIPEVNSRLPDGNISNRESPRRHRTFRQRFREFPTIHRTSRKVTGRNNDVAGGSHTITGTGNSRPESSPEVANGTVIVPKQYMVMPRTYFDNDKLSAVGFGIRFLFYYKALMSTMIIQGQRV